jgi:hypothetical protein
MGEDEDDNEIIEVFMQDLELKLYRSGVNAYRQGRPPLTTMGDYYMTGYNETKFLYMDSAVC